MRTGEEEEKELPPTFALAAKRFRAFDLSCRACGACGAGAGCWAWIPGWETFGFHPQPPIEMKNVSFHNESELSTNSNVLKQVILNCGQNTTSFYP